MALGAAVLMMAPAAVSAQPRGQAFLVPVEGGRWEASLGSPPVEERICLNASGYVLAGRVEPGYSALWMLSREGEFGGYVGREGFVATEGFVTGNTIGENDGSRWSWSSFMAADGQCFDMWAVVRGGPQEGRQSFRQMEQQTALRVRLYMLRVGVDW